MSDSGAVYEITVRGHLDRHWATWSGCVELVHRDDGTTTLLTGPVDQARLHGILTRLGDMGAFLVAVVEQGSTRHRGMIVAWLAHD